MKVYFHEKKEVENASQVGRSAKSSRSDGGGSVRLRLGFEVYRHCWSLKNPHASREKKTQKENVFRRLHKAPKPLQGRPPNPGAVVVCFIFRVFIHLRM